MIQDKIDFLGQIVLLIIVIALMAYGSYDLIFGSK